MRLTRFLCVFVQMILLRDVLGICEEIEFIPEGEIIVTGDDVIFDGVTEVEGNVPMTGNVVFEGPVRASGTVTIVGTSQPMLPPFGLGQSVGTPMVMPNYYIPYHLLPNTWYAPDMTLGYGNSESCGEDLSVIGETLLEGYRNANGPLSNDWWQWNRSRFFTSSPYRQWTYGRPWPTII
ncbi:uncharacterized protein LOC106715182 [Papilio machaon]|uniref:uncharacterized protein LOC106715182 n=1 Tax=Papilio machaon TaxID=76193 RepID=UPI001E66465C|nr:uncharacterized protein LOC106715182 [Papilio machaon]